jgi:hypothetical protein
VQAPYELVPIRELLADECDLAILEAYAADGSALPIDGYRAIYPNRWPRDDNGVDVLFVGTLDGRYYVDRVQLRGLKAKGRLPPPAFRALAREAEPPGERAEWETQVAIRGLRAPDREASAEPDPAPPQSEARDTRLIGLAHSWRADVLKYGGADDNVTRARRVEARWSEKKKRPRSGLIAYALDDKSRGSKNRGRLKSSFRKELARLQAKKPEPKL